MSPERVVVVANEASDESVALAQYYMEKRAIPEENLFLVNTTLEEEIPWVNFVREIFNPLRRELIEADWLDGFTNHRRDHQDRLRLTVFENRIDALVAVWGIPVKMRPEKKQLEEALAERLPQQLRRMYASVDGELALLARDNTPLVGPVRNDLFNRLDPSGIERDKVVRVLRLDGPEPADVRRMIDRTLEAEAKGPVGRAYVDIRGPHQQGRDWLDNVAEQIRESGFDLDVATGRDFHHTERMDAAALYFTWHSFNIKGPPVLPGFEFAPGAIAMHIHSYSAAITRSRTERWVGPLVSRGVSATVGNVSEPYLGLTHHLHLLLRALLAGQTFGEAAYYSLPYLSWQAIAIGDPLYRPFPEGWEDREIDPDSPFEVYELLRRANLLVREGNGQAALALMDARRREIEVALWLADYHLARDEEVAAREVLLQAREPVLETPSRWMIRSCYAKRLAETKAPLLAVEQYRLLLELEALDDHARERLLRQGLRLARQVHRDDLVSVWDEELNGFIRAKELERLAREAEKQKKETP